MKKALLVGINDYPGSQNDLQGCVNDITNVYDVLVKYFGFAGADVALLQDKRATRAAIMKGLKDMVGSAGAGDALVFHYSGHGSQVRDAEGDELSDQLDEIICPWDFDWDGTFIKDDDFAVILKDVKKGVALEVILDSCHSGTGTREIILDKTTIRNTWPVTMNEGALWASRHCIRPRYLAPPADIALRADQVFAEELECQRVGVAAALNHVLWSACKSDQYSADADLGGRPNGAFTYYFCKHIRDTAGKVSRADLLKFVRASLKHEGFSQVPQLECPAAFRGSGVFT